MSSADEDRLFMHGSPTWITATDYLLSGKVCGGRSGDTVSVTID